MKNSRRLMLAISGLVLVFTSTYIQAQDTNGIRFKPERLNFNTASIGTCRPRKIEATNQTGSAISNPEFKVVDSKAFRVQSRFKCPNPLQPGKTCKGYINFCPPYYEIYEGALVFTGSKQRVIMIGEGRSSNQE